MFMRQGIVWAALGVVLLGSQSAISQTKPADLPLDPRVECREEQEIANLSASPDAAALPPYRGQPAPEKETKPAGEQNLVGSLLLGLNYDFIFGVVMRLKLTDANEKNIDLLIPLPCSPEMKLAAWALERICENFAKTVAHDEDEDEQPSEVGPELRDPEFLKMLRITEPLNLPPILPDTDEAMVWSEEPIRRASYEPTASQADRLAILRQLPAQAAANIGQAPHSIGYLPRLNDSAYALMDIQLMNRMQTASSSAQARRNCPRNDILYVDPAPRRLTIRED